MPFQDPNAAIKTAFPDTNFKTGDQVTVGSETYTFGSDGNFTQSNAGTSATDKLTTPTTWDGPEDARKLTGAGKYPNFYVHKTRSGHTLIMDDSKGAEHVTLQHRGGTMVQLQPDGKLYISAQNGQYNIVFGENRMKITGAYDITVDGAASLKVNKDYNMTVGGDINLTATKNINMTAQNFNQTIRGNIDVAAKGITEKVEGAVLRESIGNMTLSSQGAFMAGSSDNSAAFYGKDKVAINADQGELMVRSAKKMSFESMTGDIVMQATAGKISSKSMQNYITATTLFSIKGLAAGDITTGGLMQVKSGAALLMGATGEVGVTGGAAVAISAVGEVGLDAGAGIGIAAAGAVGIESASIGLNASLIASLGIIQQNGPVVVAVPPPPPTPVIPVVVTAPTPDNPKTDFLVTASTNPTQEDASLSDSAYTEVAGYA